MPKPKSTAALTLVGSGFFAAGSKAMINSLGYPGSIETGSLKDLEYTALIAAPLSMIVKCYFDERKDKNAWLIAGLGMMFALVSAQVVVSMGCEHWWEDAVVCSPEGGPSFLPFLETALQATFASLVGLSLLEWRLRAGRPLLAREGAHREYPERLGTSLTKGLLLEEGEKIENGEASLPVDVDASERADLMAAIRRA